MNKQNDPAVINIEHFDDLNAIMHKAEKKRTLEEQIAYLKSQGIDLSKTYRQWDDDKTDDDW